MSEKSVVVLLCDMPHRREVRAVDTLIIRSALGGKELNLDVCGAHQEMLFNGRKMRVRAAVGGENEPEQMDRVPAGWVDTEQAAEILDMSKAGVLYQRKKDRLTGRVVSIPGRRGPIFIFERAQVRALARGRG